MDVDPSGSGGWRFAQCFGDKGDVEDITEGAFSLPSSPGSLSLSLPHSSSSPSADIISTVEFDSTGNYLATGDKGGRVVLFERNESVGPLSVVLLLPCLMSARCPPSPTFSPAPVLGFHIDLDGVEKGLRIQVLHRISVPRTRVRLSQVIRNRGKDQQDQVVQTTEHGPSLVDHKRCVNLLLYIPPCTYDPPAARRQDHQVVESVRKVLARRLGDEPLRRAAATTAPQHSRSSQTPSHDVTRKHNRRTSSQGLRQRTCIPHPLHIRQLRPGNLYFCRRSPCQPLESRYQQSEL